MCSQGLGKATVSFHMILFPILFLEKRKMFVICPMEDIGEMTLSGKIPALIT